MWKPTVAAVLLALVSCSAPAEPEPGPADVAVELDAFSGLPNPRWTLSADQAAELARRLSDLPRSDAALPEGVLGYRGFWVRNPGGEGGIPESVYVSRGGLVRVVAERGPSPVFRDAHGAEQWLIADASARGYGEVFSRGSAGRFPLEAGTDPR